MSDRQPILFAAPTLHKTLLTEKVAIECLQKHPFTPPSRPGWFARVWFVCALAYQLLCELVRRLVQWLAPHSWLWPHLMHASPKVPSQLDNLFLHSPVDARGEHAVEALSSFQRIIQSADFLESGRLAQEAGCLKDLFAEWRAWPSLLATIDQKKAEHQALQAAPGGRADVVKKSEKAVRQLMGALRAAVKMKERRAQRVLEAVATDRTGTLVGVTSEGMEVFHFVNTGGEQVAIRRVVLSTDATSKLQTASLCCQKKELGGYLECIERHCSQYHEDLPSDAPVSPLFQPGDLPEGLAALQERPQSGELAPPLLHFVRRSAIDRAPEGAGCLVDSPEKEQYLGPVLFLEHCREFYRSFYLVGQLSGLIRAFPLLRSFQSRLVSMMQVVMNRLREEGEKVSRQVGLPFLEDWEPALFDVEQAICVPIGSPVRPIVLGPEHQAAAGNLSKALELTQVERAALEHPVSTLSGVTDRLEHALAVLSEHDSLTLYGRSICLAHLAGISTPLEGPGTREELDRAFFALHALRERMQELFNRFSETAVTPTEWWTLQELNALECYIGQERLIALLAEPGFSSFFRQTQDELRKIQGEDRIFASTYPVDGQGYAYTFPQLLDPNLAIESGREGVPRFTTRAGAATAQMHYAICIAGVTAAFQGSLEGEWGRQLREQAPTLRAMWESAQMWLNSYKALSVPAESVYHKNRVLEEPQLGCEIPVHSACVLSEAQAQKIKLWKSSYTCYFRSELDHPTLDGVAAEKKIGLKEDTLRAARMLLGLSMLEEIPKAPLLQRGIESVVHWFGLSVFCIWRLPPRLVAQLRPNLDTWIWTGKVNNASSSPNPLTHHPYDTAGIVEHFFASHLPKETLLPFFPDISFNSWNQIGDAAFGCPYMHWDASGGSVEARRQMLYYRAACAKARYFGGFFLEVVNPKDLTKALQGPWKECARPGTEEDDDAERLKSFRGYVYQLPFEVQVEGISTIKKQASGLLEAHVVEESQCLLALPPARRVVFLHTELYNQLLRGENPLFDRFHLGRAVMATTGSLVEAPLSEQQQHTLCDLLQKMMVHTIAPGPVARQARWLAWIARSLRYLEPARALSVLEPLRGRKAWGDLLHRHLRHPGAQGPDLARMLLWLDQPMEGERTYLEELCGREGAHNVHWARAHLLEEGDLLTSLPLDGPRAEWCRDARAHYLEVWFPWVVEHYQDDPSALERIWAGSVLRLDPATLQCRDEGTARTFFSPHGGISARVSLATGTCVLEMGSGGQKQLAPLPGGALGLVPSLRQMVGSREIFTTWRGEQGERRYRVLEQDGLWIDYLDDVSGGTLQGWFPDPLAREAAPELWHWRGALHPGDYAPLDHWGFWVSAQGAQVRLIPEATFFSARPERCYRGVTDPQRCNTLVGFKAASGLMLLPHPKEENLSARLRPFFSMLVSHRDVCIEGTARGEIRRVTFPGLDSLHARYQEAPPWAPPGTPPFCWHLYDQEQHYVIAPELMEDVSTILGGSVAARCLPLCNAKGQFFLWVIPSQGGPGAMQENDGVRPIRLELEGVASKMMALCPMSPHVLLELFEVLGTKLESHQALLYVSKYWKRSTLAAASREEALAIWRRLQALLQPVEQVPLAVQLSCAAWAVRQGIFKEVEHEVASAVGRLCIALANPPGSAKAGWLAVPDPEDVCECIKALEIGPHNPEGLALVREQLGRGSALTYLEKITGSTDRPLPLLAPVSLPQLDRLELPQQQACLPRPLLDRQASLGENYAMLESLYSQCGELGRVYQRSLGAPEHGMPPVSPGSLLEQIRGERATWEGSRHRLEELVTRYRTWIRSALPLDETFGLGALKVRLLYGDETAEPDALREVLELWGSGALNEEWAPRVETMVQSLCAQQVLDRLLAAVDANSEEQLTLALQQYETIAHLSAPEGDPVEEALYRQRLVMQALRGLIIRDEQVAVVRSILEPENRSLQLRPGFGKTDIILPLLLRTGRTLRQGWTVVVPKHLLGMAREGLSRSMDVCVLHCEREDLEGEAAHERILSWIHQLQQAREGHVPVVLSAETLPVLEVAIAERQYRKACEAGDPEELSAASTSSLEGCSLEGHAQHTDSSIEMLQKLRALLREDSRHLLDEVDAICAPNRKLVFAEGSAESPPPVYVSWTSQFFGALLHAPPELLQDPDVQKLALHFKQQTTALLLNHASNPEGPQSVERALCALAACTLASRWDPAVIERVLSREALPTAILQGWVQEERELALYIRQMLYRSMPLVLGRAEGREYGWSSTRTVGVPYNQGEEEPDTQFSEFADQMAFTFACACFSVPLDQKLLEEQWDVSLARLQQKGPHLAHQFQELRQDAERRNHAQGKQSVLEIMRAELATPGRSALRLALTEVIYAQHIQTFPQSFERRMADVVRGLQNPVGITGTLRTQQLPSVFHASSEEERMSSAEVHAALLRTDLQPEELPEGEGLEQICALAGRYDAILNQNGVGHNPTEGSGAVALAIAAAHQVPVAFYDPTQGNRLITLHQGRPVEQAYMLPMPSGCKYYFGPHDLRGVNLPMPESARAVYLPSATVLDDSLEQAVRRLRLLSRHQTVTLCLTSAIVEALRDSSPSPLQGRELTKAFLRTVLQRTGQEEVDLQQLQEKNERTAADHAQSNWRVLELDGQATVGDFADLLRANDRISAQWQGGIPRTHVELSTQIVQAQEQEQEQQQEQQKEQHQSLQASNQPLPSIPRIGRHVEGYSNGSQLVEEDLLYRQTNNAHLVSRENRMISAGVMISDTWKILKEAGCRPASTVVVWEKEGELRAFLGNLLEQREVCRALPSYRIYGLCERTQEESEPVLIESKHLSSEPPPWVERCPQLVKHLLNQKNDRAWDTLSPLEALHLRRLQSQLPSSSTT